jgi:hypothetical protein
MTLCAAAICDWGGNGANGKIVAVTDHMITLGTELGYEPDQTKMWQYNESILFFVAGKITSLTAIFNAVCALNPEEPKSVGELAALYADLYWAFYRKGTEQGILNKWGLTVDTFIARQNEMRPEFVMDIKDQIEQYDNDEEKRLSADIIIAGIDETRGRPRPELYTVCDGEVSNCENLGYAVIGSGGSLAESQLVLAGQSKFCPFGQTMMLLYSAKRRAEANPYVGRETDMFVIGPGLNNTKRINEFMNKELLPIYSRQERADKARLGKASTQIEQAWTALTDKLGS